MAKHVDVVWPDAKTPLAGFPMVQPRRPPGTEQGQQQPQIQIHHFLPDFRSRFLLDRNSAENPPKIFL
jgi:hypothetical protein